MGRGLPSARRVSWIVGVLWLLSACSSQPPVCPPPPVPAAPLLDTTSWPRPEVMNLALAAYQCAAQRKPFDRPVLTVIDYSLPSNEPRLWVIDVDQHRVLHHELVAHGEGSGTIKAVRFSNDQGSHQSSLGLFRTEGTYFGRYGYSLRLAGLEPGINDRARERAIVVHGMSQVSSAFAAEHGAIATSWGCLAVPETVAAPLIDSIAGGSAIFAYYPDDQWLHGSHYLHCDVQHAGLNRSGPS